MNVTIILFLRLSKILYNTGTNDLIGRMIATKEYGYMKYNYFQKQSTRIAPLIYIRIGNRIHIFNHQEIVQGGLRLKIKKESHSTRKSVLVI